MQPIMSKPTSQYEYWYVGYVTGDPETSFGRVEVTRTDSESPWADYEIGIKAPISWLRDNDLHTFIDNLVTDYPVKTQEELLKLFNEYGK